MRVFIVQGTGVQGSWWEQECSREIGKFVLHAIKISSNRVEDCLGFSEKSFICHIVRIYSRIVLLSPLANALKENF